MPIQTTVPACRRAAGAQRGLWEEGAAPAPAALALAPGGGTGTAGLGVGEDAGPVCPPLCPAKCSCFYLGLTAFGGACFLLHSQGLGFWVQKQEHPYV